ncbi:MAG: hypothetical protein E6R03_11970 [Hyphomicrobiaceae bacterium]|nr:MAG: hypothetical protein E6R03_11970 [Hyphomicrobiaceae bacterium]
MADYQPTSYNEFRNRMAAMNAVTQGIRGGVDVLSSAFANRAKQNSQEYKDMLDAALRLRMAQMRGAGGSHGGGSTKSGQVLASDWSKYRDDFVRNNPGKNVAEDDLRKMFLSDRVKPLLQQMASASGDALSRDWSGPLANINSFLSSTSPKVIQAAAAADGSLYDTLSKATPIIQKLAQTKGYTANGFDPSAYLVDATRRAGVGVQSQAYNQNTKDIGTYVLNPYVEKAKADYQMDPNINPRDKAALIAGEKVGLDIVPFIKPYLAKYKGEIANKLSQEMTKNKATIIPDVYSAAAADVLEPFGLSDTVAAKKQSKTF